VSLTNYYHTLYFVCSLSGVSWYHSVLWGIIVFSVWGIMVVQQFNTAMNPIIGHFLCVVIINMVLGASGH